MIYLFHKNASSKRSIVGQALLAAALMFPLSNAMAAPSTQLCPLTSAKAAWTTQWPAPTNTWNKAALQSTGLEYPIDDGPVGYSNAVKVQIDPSTVFDSYSPYTWTEPRFDLPTGSPLNSKPYGTMQVNISGEISFTFAHPLDQNSGIIFTDVDMPSEVVNLQFLDDAGNVLDPSSWAVSSLTSNPDGLSSTTITKTNSRITLVGQKVQNQAAFMITPAPGSLVKKMILTRSTLGSDGSAFGLIFAQWGCGPVAINDSGSGIIGTPVKVATLGNDTTDRATLDPASVQINDPAATNNGKTLVVAGQGTWTVNSDGSITFTPQAGYTGNPTPIPYTVADLSGLRSPPALVTVTYALPTAVPSTTTWGLVLLSLGMMLAMVKRRRT